MKYTVRKGDVLSSIAGRELGDPSRWPEIWDLNKSTLRSGDPDLIFPGEILVLPENEPEPPTDDDAPENEIRLYVDGQIYTGWISVAIKRSIEEAAASFTLEVVAPRKTDPPPWMYLEARAKCKVTIGPDTVVSGYIDKANPEIDATTFRNTVEGRDKTADVIDCDAQGGPEWRDAGLEEIARAHCRPFGVDVVSDLPDNPTIKLHRLQQAETGYDSLERIAREQGFLISSTPDGELWLTRSDQARSVSAELELSRNILKISNPKNSRDRFGEYTVKTQNGAKGTATDSFFSRPRPRTIIPEKGSNAAGARMRAAWHAKVTAARADSLAVTVAGWRDSAGDLYSVHTIIPVNAPEMQVAGDWQITETGFKLSASEGETTELTLRRPDAFTPEPGKAVA